MTQKRDILPPSPLRQRSNSNGAITFSESPRSAPVAYQTKIVRAVEQRTGKPPVAPLPAPKVAPPTQQSSGKSR